MVLASSAASPEGAAMELSFSAVRTGTLRRVRRSPAALVFLVGLAALTQVSAGTGAEHVRRHARASTYTTNEIVIRARPGANRARLEAQLSARGLSLGGRIPHTRVFAVHTRGKSPAAAIRALAHEWDVAAAVPNHVVHALEMPNDPYFETGASYLEAIRLPEAWDVTHGSAGFIIAVVDTGVAPVADLSAQLLPGRTFVPGGTDTRDDSLIGHGTSVAGIAAATTNNGIGIAGGAWDARVLPVKVLNAQGNGSVLQVAAGIVWAVDDGARVVNLSLGSPSGALGLCDAVNYADSRGALVVAAAGNSGTGTRYFPAACPGAVAVSATDSNGDFAYFSTFGPQVDLAAPGVDVISTSNDGSYDYGSGTSLAAPMVSAVAALVMAQHPDWSPGRVAAQLEETAQDRGPAGHDQYYGHGLLDAYGALGGPHEAPVFPSRDAFEPNDSPSVATPLTRSARSTISPEGDVDWYRTTIRRPCIATFRVVPPYDVGLGPNMQPVLQLFDRHLELLDTRNATDSGRRVSMSFRLPAGRYYVRVSNDNGARSPGTYSLMRSTRLLHHVKPHVHRA
jgi:subtilisin family serine protease